MRRLIVKENVWTTLLALMFLCLLSASSLSAQSIKFYVDQVNGVDTRDCVDARNPNTPVQTIKRVINGIQGPPEQPGCILDGDTIIVKPGLYEEMVDLKRNFVTLRAEPRRGATIRPPAPTSQVVLVESLVGITVEGFIIEGGTTGISFINRSDNGIVRDNVVHSNTVHGINFSNSMNGLIEKNIVHKNNRMGIRYINGADGVVRNNLVYNNVEWGISLEMDPDAFSSGNVIESNTVDQNGDGVRLLDGGGFIQNNIITNNGPTGLKLSEPLTQVQEDHNNVFGHTTNFDYNGTDRPPLTTISLDPLYVDPAGADGVLGGDGWEDDSYHLSQIAAGQQVDSPCVDVGSDPAAGSPTDGSTATDNFPDEETLDMGFHYAIFRSTLKVFSLTSIKNAIEKKGGQLKATYNLLGKITLGNDSNGIDPDTQRVRVEIDTYSQTLPLGACKQLSTKVWTCSGPTPGVTFVKIDLAKGTFEVAAKALPAPASTLPPNVRLRLFLGDDIGVAEMFYVKGTLLAP